MFTITVNKNLNTPAWIGTARYEVTIPSNEPLGRAIITLRADDADTTVRLSVSLILVLVQVSVRMCAQVFRVFYCCCSFHVCVLGRVVVVNFYITTLSAGFIDPE